jgi:hypothetical protein
MYYNGLKVNATWTGTTDLAPPSDNNPIDIGANGDGSEGFDGDIDDVRIYNRNLSASEVSTLAQPGYDIEVRKASSYPGTGFSWGNPTASVNGSSSTDAYFYPAIALDSASKIWIGATRNNAGLYTFNAVQSTNANDVTLWQTADSLNQSANANKYGVIAARTSGDMQAIYMDGTAISSKNYTSGAWDGSPTSIATGTTGLTTTLSATADSTGNVHLTYIDSAGATKYQEYTSSWQTAVTLDSNASNAYPTIALDSATNNLYAFWIRGNHIYYKKGVSSYASGNWDAAATDWKTTGTNTYVSSNLATSNQIFAEWYDGSAIAWDKIVLNTAPNSPSSLAQKTTSDVTISTGGWHNATSIKFTATATDTDNPDTLSLCIEKDDINTAFSNTEDACGTGVSYTGTGVTVTVTISSQTDATEYHWQARLKDAAGAYSSWVAYGANSDTTPGAARDYGIDTTAPTGGTVYDGTSAGVDATFSTTSLTTLSANWSGFDSNVSGLNKYQYSIGTTAGGTDVKTWTDNSTTTSVTDSSLTLQTSQLYFVNVRAVDNAGNTSSVVSSNGQMVAPSLAFTVTPSTLTFANLSASNSYTDSQNTTLSTTTNANAGYIIRAFVTDYLRSTDTASTIADFTGGTYASPAAWGASTGLGYTSSDTTIQGSNKFSGATLYAPFNHTGPGDIVADNTTSVTGGQSFTITNKVATTAIQAAKSYRTTVVYTVTAQY